MGCCTTTQLEKQPYVNTQPEKQPFVDTGNKTGDIDDIGHEQANHRIIAKDDTDDDDIGDIKHIQKKKVLKKVDSKQRCMEDRIKIGHGKFHDKSDKKDNEEDITTEKEMETNNIDEMKGENENENEPEATPLIDNKALIAEITDNPPIPGDNDNNYNLDKASKRGLKDPLYDMISTEHLRYVITDLIESNNKKLNDEDIVTSYMIRKLLSKWKSNLSKLYLKLLDEYKATEMISSGEINKNIAIHRLSDDYKMGKKLGRGAYAIVKLASRCSDNKEFAAKIVTKRGLNKWDLRGLRLEIAIMRDLNHDNVVTLYDVFESSEKIGLIIGLLQGGELLDSVIAKGSFSENEASQCFAQLCDGLNYIHSKNIAHRDLKPDNLLFEYKITDWSNLPKDSLKLVDFGLAERCKRNRGLTEYCGTPIYMAPEIYSHKEYNYSCDMWSAGCILYALLVGYPPFDFDEDHDINELSKSVRNDPIDFDPEYWSQISDDAKDLICKLLERDPNKRYTAKQALQHKWMKSASSELFDQRRMDRLRKFNYVRKLKRGVNAMIAVIRLIEIFEWFSDENSKKIQTVQVKQENVIQDIGKLNFMADKIEDRINSIKSHENDNDDDDDDDDDNNNNNNDNELESEPKNIEPLTTKNREDDSEEDDVMAPNYDKSSSLHQTTTVGKITMKDDDDDDDSD